MRRRGGEQPEVIELIPVDADVFAGSGPAQSSAPTVAATSRTTVPQMTVTVTTAVLALLAVAAVVAVALLPGERPGRLLAYPPLRRQLPTLDGHVVFTDPPGGLIAAGDGGLDGGPANPSSLRLAAGYTFAEDGAHFTLSGDDAGRWAQFWTEPGLEGPDDVMNGTIQGVPASIDSYGPELVFTFGPVDGRVYRGRTHDMGLEATMRFAENIGVRDDGSPFVRDDHALAGLHPLGSTAEYGTVLDTLLTPGDSSVPASNVVFVRYADGDDRLTMSSAPAPADDMFDMLQYFFPQGHRRDLRGTQAWVLGDGVQPDLLASGTGTLVAWVEGGRLLMVVTPYDEQTTLALAEGARAATAEEWSAVEKVAARTPNPLSSTSTLPGKKVELLVGMDPSSGEATTVTATWDGDQLLTVCAELKLRTQCSNGPVQAPYIDILQVDETRYAVVVVPDAAAGDPEVRLTFDGGIREERYLLSSWGPGLPGPAIALLLPDGVTAVELWDAGTLVGTAQVVSPTG